MTDKKQRPNILNNAAFPEVIDLIPAGAVAHLGIATPVPVLGVKLADQRKWCVNAQRWLDGEWISPVCPTKDLRADGSCMRSSGRGKCLLLLPFSAPDWKPACRWRYDWDQEAMMDRTEPVVFPDRLPLSLEQLEVAYANA